MVSLEIATHFFNCVGLVGDTLVFMYAVDLEIEKSFFGELQPYSCPPTVREIINNVRINDEYNDE